MHDDRVDGDGRRLLLAYRAVVTGLYPAEVFLKVVRVADLRNDGQALAVLRCRVGFRVRGVQGLDLEVSGFGVRSKPLRSCGVDRMSNRSPCMFRV